MANLKDIAATLAILGSGTLVLGGCDKDKPATEVPGGAIEAPSTDAADAMPDEATDETELGEASCSADNHPEEGHCSGDTASEDPAGDENPTE